jgi:hypothetical protein
VRTDCTPVIVDILIMRGAGRATTVHVIDRYSMVKTRSQTLGHCT